jgi:hypothetical protein
VSKPAVAYANDWVATDALGRSLPMVNTTGPSRSGKFVGVFYWLWHANTRLTRMGLKCIRILLLILQVFKLVINYLQEYI